MTLLISKWKNEKSRNNRMKQRRDAKAQRLKILYQRWAAKLGLSILVTNAFFPEREVDFFLIFYKLLILEKILIYRIIAQI